MSDGVHCAMCSILKQHPWIEKLGKISKGEGPYVVS